MVKSHKRPRLSVTPAMVAGVSQKLWSMEDVVAMIEDWEAKDA